MKPDLHVVPSLSTNHHVQVHVRPYTINLYINWPSTVCSSPQFVQQKLLKADFHGAVLTGLQTHGHIYHLSSFKCFAAVIICTLFEI